MSSPKAVQGVGSRLRMMLAALVWLGALGCSKEIDTDYGGRRGSATYSVNGTAVLGEMFEAAGHEVYSWSWLSPRLQDRADCIVWFPDDYEPPSDEVREWLEVWLAVEPGFMPETWYGDDSVPLEWLREESQRTLIYVCRDFDAAAWYWNEVIDGAPPEQLGRLRQQAALAKDDFEIDRLATPQEEDCEWFGVRGKYQPRKVRTLDGPWAEGIDASKVEIELSGRIDAAQTAEVLLESEGDVLVARHEWDGCQVIVVANGSFLLNLPLVNHEHRKLAGRLIDEVGEPGKTVVFLESHAGGPSIRDEDPAAEIPTGMEIFFHFPSGWILWHFTAIGVVFCFSRWPIFGLPRRLKREDRSDFGKHVEAVAELLERSGDEAYALGRLAHYQQVSGEW